MVSFTASLFTSIFSLLLLSTTPTAAVPSSVTPSSAALAARTTTYVCGTGESGIKSPKKNAHVSQLDNGSGGCTNITIVYCSGAYDKVSSIDTSVWLSGPGTSAATAGTLLAKDVVPNNLDAPGGYYSYRYNVAVCPEEGQYITGSWLLSVYETETGYYNAYDFALTSVALNFTTTRT